MINKLFKYVLFLAVSIGAAVQVHAQRGQERAFGRGAADERGMCWALINAIPKLALDSTEAAGIIYMREEEKLAHDVYASLHAKWGLPIFGNISQSEDRHANAMLLLLARYGLQDPSAGKPIGIFQNEGLQELYNSLLAEGERSAKSALRVGATIEEIDIRDLAKASEATDNSDLKTVYQNLSLASENHLRVFIRQLNAAGETYVPQHIDQIKFSGILANQQQMGGGNNARGNGRGRGNNGNCPWVNP